MAYFTKEEQQILLAAKGKLRAAAHPLREKILVYIREKKNRVAVKEIYKALREEQSVISSQLAILRGAGLVVPSREGQQIFYAVNEEAIKKLLKNSEELIS